MLQDSVVERGRLLYHFVCLSQASPPSFNSNLNSIEHHLTAQTVKSTVKRIQLLKSCILSESSCTFCDVDRHAFKIIYEARIFPPHTYILYCLDAPDP